MDFEREFKDVEVENPASSIEKRSAIAHDRATSETMPRSNNTKRIVHRNSDHSFTVDMTEVSGYLLSVR